MKRSIFAATLLLTPALLHAQASTPAQTGLQALAIAPAAILAAAPKDTTTTVRVSTGVVAPRLLSPITLATGLQGRVLADNINMVVTLTVDATGKPSDIAISEPTGVGLDRELVAAITQARFKPGTLDGQAFALPVRLNVVIERGARY